MYKKCANCKKIKHDSEFTKDKSKKDGFRCSCKDCERERKKNIPKNHPFRKCGAIINGQRCNSNFLIKRYKGKGDWLCDKHYSQMRKNGKLFQRTIFDKNKIIKITPNICAMTLYNRNCEAIDVTIFNVIHLKPISNHKWSLNDKNYVCSSIKNKIVELQRFIKGKKPGFIVHHRDGNPLNNLNNNLAFATISQNGMLRKLGSNNITGKVGVMKNYGRGKPWKAGITLRSKYIHLGYYDSKKEAIKARLEAEKKYFNSELDLLKNFKLSMTYKAL